MTVLLRHASAGEREEWSGDDWERPLDARGRRQAEALVDVLGPTAPTRILSSPFARCLETVQPLAAALRLEVEPVPALAEGASPAETRELLDAAGAAVLSTHGDVIESLLGPSLGCEKGAFWEIDVAEDGRVVPVRYVRPRA